jgi:hypothetical protein
MNITVVISAYKNWDALHWTLMGYRLQARPPDELIVAEDSQFEEVAQVVHRHAALATFPIRHLSQEDRGFRKCRILNQAIAAAQGDWLVFTDADCIPRADLVAAHEARARKGLFLAGGSHISLPVPLQAQLLNEDSLRSQRLFDPRHLSAQGVQVPGLRLTPHRPLARFLDALTPRNAFVGCNAGAWRADLLSVCGFDEAFGYGAEDRNLGIRLNNLGIRGVRARYSLAWLHLDHPRAYANPEAVNTHRALNDKARRDRAVLPNASLLLP